MTIVLAVGLGVLGLLLVARVVLYSDPAAIVRLLRLAGPLGLGAVGLALVAAGRAGFGVPLAALGLLWLAVQSRRGGRQRKIPIPSRASVRSAAIEMELIDGELDGLVLAGRYLDRRLSTLTLAELLDVHQDLRSDPESSQLLEAYLDGRFPVWRLHAQANGGSRLGGPPGAGAMTEEEAYKILGLEAGASSADIRKAHRRLIERLDTRIASESLLAARIDEAKAILLAKQG